MPTPETKILDDEAVAEIEKRIDPFSLSPFQARALIATVKHLREMMADPVFGFQELQTRLTQMQKERDYWRIRATEASAAAEKWYHERY